MRIRLSAPSGKKIGWKESLEIANQGFSRIGEVIVRAPDLHVMTRAGFRHPKRRLDKVLLGTRLSFIQLIAETGLPVVAGDEELRQLADVLRGEAPAEIIDPPGLRSVLRPYQRDGVAWLWTRYLARVGALLADDMGLGKTHQIMGLLCLIRDPQSPDCQLPGRLPEGGPGALEQPALDLRTEHSGRGLPRAPFDDHWTVCDLGGQLVLTTYDLPAPDHRSALRQSTGTLAVFDEAQRIKNPRDQGGREPSRNVFRQIFNVALTGTPSKTDCWSSGRWSI